MYYRLVIKPHTSSTSREGRTVDFDGSVKYRDVEAYVTLELERLACQDNMIFEFASGGHALDSSLPEPYGVTTVLYAIDFDPMHRARVYRSPL